MNAADHPILADDLLLVNKPNQTENSGWMPCPCKLPTWRHFLIAPRSITRTNRYYSTVSRDGDGRGIELLDDTPRTIRDFLTPSRVSLLDLILQPYLPPALQDIRYKSTELPPAYHFLFFPTSTSELDTLPDGYERHFAPKHSFKRRLWTQGRLQFGCQSLRMASWGKCDEKILRVSGDEKGTDVWMERQIGPSSQASGEWSIRELRCLRYQREIRDVEELNGLGPGAEMLATDCILKHTFTPSRILLTRYSYLTHNFHRIHIDPDYARSVERYPDVLVHGPLSVTLILTMWSRSCISRGDPIALKSVKYVMYRPLYVNDPTTITITATKSGRKRAILWNNHNQKAVECIINSS